MARMGKSLEDEYGRQFPYGDYTYSQEGYNAQQAGSAAASLRTRFLNYENMVMGRTAYNPNAVASTRPGVGDYVVGPGVGAALSEYGTGLADVGRRSANRWGANFELQRPNDPLLDAGSVALDAGAVALLAAGAAAAAPAVATGTGVAGGLSELGPVGGAIVRGVPAFAQNAASPLARYAGTYLPMMVNTSIAGLNPLPAITGALTSGAGAAAIPATLAAWFGSQAASNNYINAARDAAAMGEAYPDSTSFDRARQFGSSALAGGGSFDLTAANPLRIGVSALTSPVRESFNQRMQDYYSRSVQEYIRQSTDADGNLSEQALQLLSNPQFEQFLEQQGEPVFRAENPVSSALANADRFFSVNPFEMLGARNLQQTMKSDSALVAKVEGLANKALGEGRSSLQDPEVQAALSQLSPAGRRSIETQLQSADASAEAAAKRQLADSAALLRSRG